MLKIKKILFTIVLGCLVCPNMVFAFCSWQWDCSAGLCKSIQICNHAYDPPSPPNPAPPPIVSPPPFPPVPQIPYPPSPGTSYCTRDYICNYYGVCSWMNVCN